MSATNLFPQSTAEIRARHQLGKLTPAEQAMVLARVAGEEARAAERLKKRNPAALPGRQALAAAGRQLPEGCFTNVDATARAEDSITHYSVDLKVWYDVETGKAMPAGWKPA